MAYSGVNVNDSAFIAQLREEFNAQPFDARVSTARFMTYEAVMELLREHQHAMSTVRRIESRIETILESERRRARDFPVGTPAGVGGGKDDEALRRAGAAGLVPDTDVGGVTGGGDAQ